MSRVSEFVEDRRHAGQLVDATAVGRSSLDGQPPFTTLFLRIDGGVLREGRFQTSGCGFLIACCAALIELSLGRPLDDCLSIEPSQIVEFLGGVPQSRKFCADLAVAAMRDALAAVPCFPSPSVTS